MYTILCYLENVTSTDIFVFLRPTYNCGIMSFGFWEPSRYVADLMLMAGRTVGIRRVIPTVNPM